MTELPADEIKGQPARAALLFDESCYGDLVDHLRRHSGYRIVSIDGVDGAGKTTLAGRLAASLEATPVDVDCYLRKNSDASFIERIDYDNLRNALEKIGLVIVSGVLIEKVLAKIDVISDFRIYIKVVSRRGWPYLDDIETNVTGAVAACCPDFQKHDLSIAIRDYHRAVQPHVHAHAIYVRLEQTQFSG